jgi:hypothetical protein
VVGKHFDYAAICDPAVTALAQHPLKLALQRLELADSPLHLGQMPTSQGVHFRAGSVGLSRKGQQLANGVGLEAQLPSVPDEVKPRHRGSFVASLLAFSAAGGRH